MLFNITFRTRLYTRMFINYRPSIIYQWASHQWPFPLKIFILYFLKLTYNTHSVLCISFAHYQCCEYLIFFFRRTGTSVRRSPTLQRQSPRTGTSRSLLQYPIWTRWSPRDGSTTNRNSCPTLRQSSPPTGVSIMPLLLGLYAVYFLTTDNCTTDKCLWSTYSLQGWRDRWPMGAASNRQSEMRCCSRMWRVATAK